MKIICNLNDNGGAMGVRWCLDEADLAKIQKAGLVDPTIIIDIFDSPRDRYTRNRMVLNASETMCFVTFRSPGVARVCVALVGYQSALSEKNRHSKKSSLEAVHDWGHYTFRVFDFEGNHELDGNGWEVYKTEAGRDISDAKNGGTTVISLDTADIQVPESYFAKPWPKAIDWWVTWIPRNLLRRKLWDECDRRRWAIASILFQPIFIVGYYGVQSIFLLAMNFFFWVLVGWTLLWRGYRGLSKEDLPLPWAVMEAEMPTSLAKDANWSSRYLHDKDGNWLPWHRHWFQPAGMCLIVGPLLFLGASSTGVIISGVITLIGFGGMCRSFRYWWNGYDYRIGGTATKLSAKDYENAEEMKRRERIKAEALRIAATLSCPLDTSDFSPSLATVQALPPAQRSVLLRLAELKAKVCKPMAA